MQLLLRPQLVNSIKVKVLYSIFIAIFRLGIGISTLWSKKAKAWVDGRKQLFEDLETTLVKREKTIWVHCASAGEFEQAKPVIQQLKSDFPAYPIVVSFFSPSGFFVGKNLKAADHITYHPLDTASNAARFIDIINPKLVLFIKYDYWYFHLKAVCDRNIPLLLASAIFREQSVFFKWYGGLHRKMLQFFKQIFVQDLASKDALKKINVHHCSVAGDTRFDRVTAIALKGERLEKIEGFVGSEKVFIAGSTWPDDEKLIQSLAEKCRELKFIIAPHEVNAGHIQQLQRYFPNAVLYSQLPDKTGSKILIIDNIGMLSRLYRYATISYIGGGFNKSGIHNTLEAAVCGKPVLFGPNYQKFKEAKELLKAGGAFSIQNSDGLIITIKHLLQNAEALTKASDAANIYVKNNTGATQTIIAYVQENRLLTTA